LLLGAHESIAGGLHKAFERGAADGCQAIQILTRSGRTWLSKPLADVEIAAFSHARKAARVPVIAHGSYLCNLATPDPVIREKSLACFLDEVRRAEALGCEGLVFHPGSNGDIEQGLRLVSEALRDVVAATPGFASRMLIEVTAGQGACLGHRFEHLAGILERVDAPKRLGVCLDSCHLFAAGYDISSPKGYENVMKELDRVVGLKQVRAFHLNDCKKPLGCRVDRHENIGEGLLGVKAFERLVNDGRFEKTPAVLETPQPEVFARSLKVLRGLERRVR